MIQTMLITNDPDIAADAQSAGVSRIMVDLESHGKKERQASRTTFISTHQPDDIAKVRRVLTDAQLIVRVNPIHAQSKEEIDLAITSGADIIMLPMITRMTQLEQFLELVGSRALPLPLVETAYSMAHMGDIAGHPGISEVYIGLNDLHLSLGLDFLFEPLALGLMDWMAQWITGHGRVFGFGGIAAMGSGELPAQSILGEHERLGSSWVILSSRFCKDVNISQAQGRRERLAQALDDMRGHWNRLSARTLQQRNEDAVQTFSRIHELAK